MTIRFKTQYMKAKRNFAYEFNIVILKCKANEATVSPLSFQGLYDEVNIDILGIPSSSSEGGNLLISQYVSEIITKLIPTNND